MIEDVFGTIVLALAGLGALTVLGAGLLSLTEMLSGIFAWTAAPPFIGWAIIGALLGAFYGTARSLKLRRRSPEEIKHILIAAAPVLLTLLILGALAICR